jgi:eukaryotic-like serine/threonine-protein kinase
MAELSNGTVVDGRYRIVSRLGAGGMADVFLAEDEQLGRKVALKLLHRRFAEDPGFVERFRREAQSAAGLQHPNVVSVYDRGAYDGTYYIAMEYLPGRSLKQVIRQDAPLDPVQAIDLTIQVLKAARFAHRRGVIHRDLKPHNVIVDDGGHAKVTDFGIARAGASDMTETGSIMGTAQYLSPEQAQGHSVGATSDLYSVGIVLYELLTGRVPFDAESAVTIALKHVSEAPTPPRAYNPNIPPDLEQVVLWALNKNPADRPQDADQFVEVLERVKESILAGVRGERTASMPAVGGHTPAGVGPAPAGVGPAPAMAVPASAGHAIPPTMAAAGNSGVPPQPSSLKAGPGRRRRWPWVVLLILLLAGGGVAAYLLTRPAKHVVPNVIGEPLSAARTNIQNAGFTPNPIYQPDNAKAQTIISQSPQPGTKADSGAVVTVTVSQGPGDTSVPTVIGLSQAGAKRTLRAAGLKIASVQMESSDSIPAGKATRTDPGAGYQLPVGDVVTLYVSSGKAKVNIPDVTGLAEPAARNQLSKAGFSVQTKNQPTDTSTPGTVLAEDPAGGSAAIPGTTVTLTIAIAPPTVKVPTLTGQTLDTATSALRADGLKVNSSQQSVTDQAQDGIVVAQNPGTGTSVKQGSTVSLVVGKYQAPTHTGTTPTTTTPTTTTPTPPTPAASSRP